MTHYFKGARVPTLFALSALSFLLVHCQSGATSLKAKSHDPASTDGADLPGGGDDDSNGDPNDPSSSSSSGGTPVPKVDPVLTFMFDGHALHARIRANVATGATLVANVFASKNGVDNSAVDCSALKTVDVSGGQSSATGLVVDVPADANFLAGRLDGSIRTIIQGCVTDSTGQVTKLSTSLMNAWDADPVGSAATPRIFHGAEAYANACIDEIGEIPMFANGKSFDCTDPSMNVIPITATDNAGNVTSITKDTAWPLTAAESNATGQCDRPAWLDYGSNGNSQCAPFTRVGRYTNSKGTRFVIICRRYTPAPPTDPNFDIVGVIAHNPDSGKTCWLNNHLDGTSTQTTQMPPPNTPTGDKFWMNSDEIRGQGCPQCHDSDPWIHTPWVDQALDGAGHFTIPRIGDDTAYNLATKYSTFSAESFAGTNAQDQANWRQPQMLTNVGTCGSCHRIGTGGTAQQWALRSVGDASDRNFQTWLTPAFRTFAKLHWMPTTPVTQQTWASSPDATSLQMIANCGANPGSCSVADVPH